MKKQQVAQEQIANANVNIADVIAQALQAPASVKVAKQPAEFDIHQCSFKSIETSFGKMWGAKGKGVSLWVDGKPDDAEFLSKLTQGMLKSVPEKDSPAYPTYQRIRKSIMAMFAVKSYALTAEKHNNILAYMPAELCHDLQILRNLGIKAKFQLVVADDDQSVSVKYIRYVPRTNSKNNETEVTYGNIGTEATTVYVGESKHPLFAKQK